MTRGELERRWMALTREVMPALAGERGWPVRFDHCFQRILLDNACEGRWPDLIDGRPAYRVIDDARLGAAVALAEAVVAGAADLHALNERSLGWREKAPFKHHRPDKGTNLRRSLRAKSRSAWR